MNIFPVFGSPPINLLKEILKFQIKASIFCLVLIFTLFSSMNLSGQILEPCYDADNPPKCTAKDFEMVGIYLAADDSATPLVGSDCEGVDSIETYICMEIENTTSSSRDGIYIAGEFMSGSNSIIIGYCFDEFMPARSIVTLCVPSPSTFYWNCTDDIMLTNTLGIWPTAAGQMCPGNTIDCTVTTKSKCRFGEEIPVTIPLVAKFGTACVDGTSLSIQFSNETIGGTKPYVSVVWDFGDGTGSTDANPVHTYATAGVFNVTLTITDSDGNAESTSILVDSEACCEIIASDANLWACDDGGGIASFNLTVAEIDLGVGPNFSYFVDIANLIPITSPTSYSAPDKATVYVSIGDGTGCTENVTINLNINEATSISFTALADICIDAVLQTGLGGGSPTGGIYSGNGVTDDGNGMTYSFDPATAGVNTHTITYDFIDSNTCTSSASDDVEVFDLPIVSFTALADICIDAGLQTGLGGGSPTGGVYSGEGVSDDGNGMTYSFDPAAAGVDTHSLTYDFSDLNNCISSASDDTEVFDLPTVTFTALDDLCIDAGAQTNLGGGSPTGGVYSGNGVTDDGNGMTYSFDPAVAGANTHSITYIFTDSNTCASSASDDVEVLDLPTVTFTALDDHCIAAGVQTGLSGGVPAGGVYSGNGVTDDGNGTTYSFDPAAAGTTSHIIAYGFTATCASSASDDVEVFELPTVTFTALADLCIDARVQTGLGGGSPAGGVYSGDGVTDDGNGMTYSFDPSAAGVNSHIITYGFTATCVSSASDDVEVFDLPTVTFTALADLCINAGVQTGLGGGSPTGGVYSGNGITDDGNGTTYSFDPTAAGVDIHSITYDFLDSNTCASSASDDVEVFALPTVTFTALPEICVDAGVQTGLGGGSPTGGVYSGNGVTDDGNGTTYSFDPAAAGVNTHTITYNFSETNGCNSSATDDAEVYPEATVDAGSDQTICKGSTVQLNGSSGGASSTITWTTSGDGTFDDDSKLDAIYTPGTNDITAGLIMLTLSSENPIGPCGVSEMMVTFNINPNVSANAGDDHAICSDETAIIFGGPAPGLWNTSGDGTFANANSGSTTYSPGSNDITNQSVTLTWTASDPDSDGPCTDDSDDMILTINPLPIVNLNIPEELCINDGIQDNLGGGTPVGGVYSGTGVTDDGNGTSFSLDPSIGENNYTVIYTFIDQNSCENSTVDIVSVIQCCEYVCPEPAEFYCRDTKGIAEWLAGAENNNCFNATINTDYHTTNFTGGCGTMGTQIVTFSYTESTETGDVEIELCQVELTIIDTIAPTIAFVNPMLTSLSNGDIMQIQCYGQDENWSLGEAMVSDVEAIDECNSVEITVTETKIADGNCKLDGFIQRFRCTWIATDACGNTDSLFIFMELIDTIPPVLTGVPGDITVACDAIPDAEEVEARDECLCAEIEITQAFLILGGCVDGEVLQRIYSATDCCGNVTSITQNITLIDDVAPSLVVTLPDGSVLQEDAEFVFNCNSGGIPSEFSELSVHSATATESCSGIPTIEFTRNLNRSSSCSNGISETHTYEWMAFDECMNVQRLMLTLKVIDDVAPEIVNFEESVCVSDLSEINVFASDACGNAYTSYSDYVKDGGCGNEIERRYTIYDDCGNQANYVQTIIQEDNIAPTIELQSEALYGFSSGDTVALSCDGQENGNLSPFTVSDAIYFDECARQLETSFSEEIVEEMNCETGNVKALIKLIWTAIDMCGNTNTFEIYAQITDDKAPTLSNFRSEIYISCQREVPEIKAQDNCGSAEVSVVETVIEGTCPNNFDISREITAVDNCGNILNTTQLVHVVDNLGPKIIGVTPYLCEDLSIPLVYAIDACKGDTVAVTMLQDTLETANCEANFVIRRIWSATDICDNTSTIEQIISFNDNTAPELIFNNDILKYLNGTLEISMSDASAVAEVNKIDWFNIIAQDLCDGAVIRPTFSEKVYMAENCQAEGFYEKRTFNYHFADACGNTIEVNFDVLLVDDVSPYLLELPSSTDYGCLDMPEIDNLEHPIFGQFHDAQTGNMSVTHDMEMTDDLMTITNTWRAVDECGNVTLAIQELSAIINSNLACEINKEDDILCNSHQNVLTSIVTEGVAPFAYEWTIEGKDCQIQSGQGTESINIYVGFHDIVVGLTVTDANGCASYCETEILCIPKGKILDRAIENTYEGAINISSIAPNPAVDQIQFSILSEKKQHIDYSIINSMGAKIYNHSLAITAGESLINVDISNYASGAYFLQVNDSNSSDTKRFIKIK